MVQSSSSLVFLSLSSSLIDILTSSLVHSSPLHHPKLKVDTFPPLRLIIRVTIAQKSFDSFHNRVITSYQTTVIFSILTGRYSRKVHSEKLLFGMALCLNACFRFFVKLRSNTLKFKSCLHGKVSF